jgi:hypothetical protein
VSLNVAVIVLQWSPDIVIVIGTNFFYITISGLHCPVIVIFL